jgi:acyl carrier protein
MDDHSRIQQSIRSFIFDKFPAARKRGITDEALLLGSGIIDSLGVLDVVDFLEQRFAIKIEDDELTPENFGSIHLLNSFVEQKRARVELPRV